MSATPEEPATKAAAPAQKAAPTAAAKAARTSAAAKNPGGLDERLANVRVPVTIVIGRKEVALSDLGAWRGDTLVSLDQNADDPLEVHVNGTCVATAELCEGDGGEGSLAIRILDVVEAGR